MIKERNKIKVFSNICFAIYYFQLTLFAAQFLHSNFAAQILPLKFNHSNFLIFFAAQILPFNFNSLAACLDQYRTCFSCQVVISFLVSPKIPDKTEMNAMLQENWQNHTLTFSTIHRLSILSLSLAQTHTHTHTHTHTSMTYRLDNWKVMQMATQ